MLSQIDRQRIREVLQAVLIICAVFAACKLTKGFAVIGVLLYAIQAAATQKLGKALACYVLFPLLVVMNPYICSIGGMGQAFLKIGFMIQTGMLVLAAGQRHGNDALPMTGLWAYLVVSCFSSVFGYAPMISFLKLVNFSMFLFGLGFGLRNIHQRPKDLMFLRRFLLAIAVIIIFGSLVMAFVFPGIGYFQLTGRIADTYGLAQANAYARSGMDFGLLAGITNQSQCLAPLTAVTMTWVLCDMMFVEKRVSKLHLALFVAAVPLVYMTRSRCALLSAVVGFLSVSMFCFRYLSVGPRLKMALRGIFSGFVILVIAVAAIAELKDHRVSRLIRKTDDIAGDDRSLATAFTESRQGLMAESLKDFKKNPFLGTGFQVEERFQYIYEPTEIVWSAPIEKGVLPVMILGEAGILGAVVFVVFVVSFYGVCMKKRYAVTGGLFTVYLASNLGEATFFSTGGAGGILWIMALVGGFAIDMIVKYDRQLKAQGSCPRCGLM